MELLLGHMIILCLTCEEINHFSQPLESSASLPGSCGVYNISTFSLTLLALYYTHHIHPSRSILFLKSVIPLSSFTILLCNLLPCLFFSSFLLKGDTIRHFTVSLSFLWDIILKKCILLLPTSVPAINMVSQYFLLYHSGTVSFISSLNERFCFCFFFSFFVFVFLDLILTFVFIYSLFWWIWTPNLIMLQIWHIMMKAIWR